MKKFYLLILMTSIFMMSCGGHFFNPRYYYNKSSSSSSGSNPEPPAPPEELPEGVDDPFEKGDWNNPGYGGYDGNKFDSWLFQASFRGDKLPIYILKSLMVRIGYQVNQIGKEIWLIIIFLIKEKIKFMMLL